MMGIENVYGELLSGLQSENQKLLLTKLKEGGTLEKHIYVPGAEPEAAEALAQQAAFEKKVCISGFGADEHTEKWIAEPVLQGEPHADLWRRPCVPGTGGVCGPDRFCGNRDR